MRRAAPPVWEGSGVIVTALGIEGELLPRTLYLGDVLGADFG
jgi:hypothetical protein